MRAILKSLVVVTLASVPVAADAKTACLERDTVVERLTNDYGESFQGGGLQSEKRIFEVWYSEEQGTWTILLTRADGISCVMATGTNWRDALPSDKIPAGVPG